MDDVIPKNIARQFTAGAILIAHEKHGDRYFDVSSIDKARAVCLNLLRERHGVYWEKGKKKLPVAPEISREASANLKGNVGIVAQQEWRYYDQECRCLQEETEFAADVEKALKTKSNSAINLLFQRERYEYERVGIDYLEKV